MHFNAVRCSIHSAAGLGTKNVLLWQRQRTCEPPNGKSRRNSYNTPRKSPLRPLRAMRRSASCRGQLKVFSAKQKDGSDTFWNMSVSNAQLRLCDLSMGFDLSTGIYGAFRHSLSTLAWLVSLWERGPCRQRDSGNEERRPSSSLLEVSSAMSTRKKSYCKQGANPQLLILIQSRTRA